MKKIIVKIIVGLLPSMLLLSSCSKKIDDAYANPNTPVEAVLTVPVKVPVESLLPGIIGNMVGSSSVQGSAYGIANDGLYVGRYVQFWETYSTANPSSNQYDMMGGATGASDVLGSVWAMHYYGMGMNLKRMIEWGAEDKKWDYVGVGFAIRAWGWLQLTNMYGEAIMKEALNTQQSVFNYDQQVDIYAKIKEECDSALFYLNKTGDNVSQANLAKGDAYFYNGDVTKWKKFVNAVLARYYNHFSNKGSLYKPDSVIYHANLAINSNEDNAMAKFANSGITGTSNFYGPLRSNVGTLRQSKFIADLMIGANPMFTGVTDPRAGYIIRESPSGTFKGIRPNKGHDGLGSDGPPGFWGQPFTSTTAPPSDNSSRYIFRNGSPFPIITASEIQFIKAEAYWRKGDKINALAAYQQGISLSFDMLTNTPDYHNSVPTARQITPALKTAYMTNAAVVPALATNLTLSHIMLQKFIGMYGYGLVETWMDLRRFHYTDIDPVTLQQVYAGFTPPSGSDLYTNNSGKLVYRARPRYNSEYLYNINALNGIGALALDYHTKEMWITQP